MCMLDSEERGVGKRKVELVEISTDVIRIHPTIRKFYESFSEYGTFILRIGEDLPYSPRNHDYKSYHVMGDENSFSIYVKYYV